MAWPGRIINIIHGVDLIDLNQTDANAALAANLAFSFIGAKPMFASPGDLSVTTNLLGSLVERDLNGDGLPNFRILVASNFSMTASDFML